MKDNPYQRKRLIILIVFITLVTIISTSLYIFYDADPSSLSKNISGVYVNNQYSIYVLQYRANQLLFFAEKDNDFSGSLIMNDEKNLVAILGYNYELSFQNDELTINSDSTSKYVGKYHKQSDLTEEEFNNKKYSYDEISKKYNGIYKNENKIIYMYVKNKTRLSICHTYNDDFSCMIYEFDEEGKVASFPSLSNNLSKIEFYDEYIIVYDGLGRNIDYTGEYKKEANLSVKELQNLKYPIF